MKIISTILALIVSLALVLGGSPASADRDHSIERSKICVADNVNGGSVCARLILHGGSSGQQREAWSKSIKRQLPKRVAFDARYIGWSTKDVGNGIDLWAVQSIKYKNRWHLYELR